MNQRWFVFTPLDTLFFRDGRPFNQGEGAPGAATSLFPPTGATVVGALRAALARTRGWRAGPWSEDVKAVLGDGLDLKGLRVSGPHLARANGRGREMFFKAPLHVASTAGDSGEPILKHMTPGKEVLTDMGPARLPSVDQGHGSPKTLEDYFVGTSGLTRLLAWASDDVAIVAPTDLFTYEIRTGINREGSSSRTTGDNALFTAHHIRPASELELLVGVTGLPENWRVVGGLVPLGGEGRAAWLEEISAPLGYSVTGEAVAGTDRYTITLLTPANVGSAIPRPGNALEGFPGTVVSACLGRSVQIGGWSSVERGPTASEAHLPAGSTIFMRAPTALSEQQAIELANSRLGERTSWGYGEVAIGIWKERQE